MPATLKIEQAPALGASIHDPNYIVVSSDGFGLPDYKLVFDVYIGTTMIARFKIYPTTTFVNIDPYYAFMFDVSQAIRPYLQNYFNPGNALVSWTTAAHKVQYTLKIGEEYYDTSTTPPSVITNTNLISGTYSAYNCYQAIFPNGSTPIGPMVDKFLVDRDRTKLVMPRDGETLIPFWNYSGRSTIRARAFVGAVIATLGILPNAELIHLNISAATMGLTIPTTADTITIRLDYLVGASYTTLDEITIRLECAPKFQARELIFLNRCGGYETAYFSLANRKQVDYTRTSYTKRQEQMFIITPPGAFQQPQVRQYTVGTNAPNQNVYFPTDINYVTAHKVKINLISNYLSKANYDWLEQLLSSPEVYMKESGYYYPLTISDASWKEKLTSADKMFNLELTAEINRNITSQYR